MIGAVAPRTLAEAQALCRAMGVDLRVSGKGSSECADVMFPFCPAGVSIDLGVELPRCRGAGGTAQKAAIQLAEAQARAGASSGPPWLALGLGAVALGAVAYFVTR